LGLHDPYGFGTINFDAADMGSAGDPMEGSEPLVCRRCQATCDLVYDYDLELESGAYPVRWFRCPRCREEYLVASELLRPEEPQDLAEAPLGPHRFVALAHATVGEPGDESGGRSMGALVATALEEDFVDAVFLPDFGTDRTVRVITEPEEAEGLRRSWATAWRSIAVNANLVANLDVLIELERFARQDGGAHPRVAVVGRPCHVYSARRANLERLAPGYTVPITIGLFCYGNVAPSGSLALRFERITGVHPAQIRGMTAQDGNVRVVSADRKTVNVPLEEFASFLHKSCLKCVEFTVPWADVSLGESPRFEGFDVVLARTAAGEALLHRALDTGRLRAWTPAWVSGGEEIARILTDLTELKRELAQLSR